jgi:hypothetical protein
MDGAFKLRGYAIEGLLGSGGSGDVWQARVASSGARVALKRIPVCDAAQMERARAEAAMLSALDHPNLVRLHSVLAQDDAVVLVLDLADGGSLADLLTARARLTPGEVITAVAPVAAALAYLHGEEVVHGDVSAANILFAGDGAPLLADVGVARLTGDDAAAEATPAYVDPAVAAGCIPGPQSDVFMLAGVALHALTGEPPWPGEPVAALRRAARGALDDVAARLAAAGVGNEMAGVLCRALSADPHRRGSAADLALDLRHSGRPVAVESSAGRARRVPQPVVRAGPRHAAVPGRRLGERVPGHTANDPFPARSQTGREPPGDGARPGFVRPTGGPVGSVAPPTRVVGARPRPVIPRPRRRRFRPGPLALAGAALLAVLLAIAGAVSVRADGGHREARQVNRQPQLETNGSREGDRTTAVHAPAPHAAPRPTSRWPAELARLDSLRARAFAERDVSLLSRVYAPGALLRADAALLAKIVPVGCGLSGVRTTYSAVRADAHGSRIVLRTVATLPATHLMCSGRPRGRAPGTGPTRLQVELVSTSAGLRIAAERPT